MSGRKWLTPAFAVLCLTIDFVSKSFARHALSPGVITPFIPHVLNLCLSENTGAAFSLGRGNAALMTTIAATVTLLVVAWMLKRLPLDPSKLERIGMGCLLGGAVGNLVDRFSVGQVTDFLDFAFIRFPVFNAADVSIDVGIGLLVLAFWRENSQLGAQQSTLSNTSASTASAASAPSSTASATPVKTPVKENDSQGNG